MTLYLGSKRLRMLEENLRLMASLADAVNFSTSVLS